MVEVLKQSTAKNLMVFMTQAADHISGAAGLTLTISASKDGGAFATITPTPTERGNGWYSLALTTSHTDTLGDFVLHITGTGADPTDMRFQVVAYDMASSTNLGLSNLDAQSSLIKAKTDNLPGSPAAVGSAMGLSSGAITTGSFGAGAINAAAIAADAIQAAKIQTGAITNAKFAAGAIDAAAIGTGAIDADAIASNALTSAKIAAGAITATQAPNLDAQVSLIKAKTDNIGATVALETGGNLATVMAKTNNLPASPANEATSTAIKAKTDNLPVSPASESTSTDIETIVTFLQRLLANKMPWDEANSRFIIRNDTDTADLYYMAVTDGAGNPVSLATNTGPVSRGKVA